MNEEYRIVLADGTEIKNLRMNGNNFISDTEIKASDFPEAPFSAVISDGNTETMMENAELVQVKKYDSEWWFILREIPAEELERRRLAAENELLRAQVKALSDRGEFIEDCMAEMAMQVYQ